jgi:hypothetical protein
MLPKESKPTKRGSGVKHSWHWLIKHPVEFSKNNHTRGTLHGSQTVVSLGVAPGRPLRISPLARPSPWRLGQHYSPRAETPNRPPPP